MELNIFIWIFIKDIDIEIIDTKCHIIQFSQKDNDINKTFVFNKASVNPYKINKCEIK